MNDNIFNSSDLGDPDGNHIGLFDRIINIKFIRENGTTFTLRSDYEPVWDGDRLFFKPCQPKPDIRLSYTQYNGVMIQIDVFITNLNIMDEAAIDVESLVSDGDVSTVSYIQGEYTNLPNDTLTARGNKRIKELEIEVGYRGQMFDWTKYDCSLIPPEVAYAAFQNLEQLQSTNLVNQDDRIAAAELANSQLLFQAYRRCNISIEWAVNTSNPPDRVTQFHGYVGTPNKGFAPFAFQTLSDPSGNAGGTEVVLTKEEILSEVDDKHNPIDLTESEENNSWSLLQTKGEPVHRNLFNGGKAFTLLEAFCFHAVTRRFIRSNVSMKRNSLLEQAALEYSQEVQKNLDTLETVAAYQNNIMQLIYSEESVLNPDYFTDTEDKEGKKIIALTNTAPASYIETLNERAAQIIAEQNIGPRYTIKNLPEYRELYKKIRNRLAEAALKEQYMSWWAAALELKSETVSMNSLNSGIVGNTIEDARNYTLDLQSGKLNSIDCYFDTLLGKEWIVPVQTMLNSMPAKNYQGMYIQVKTPTEVVGSGFGEPGPLQSINCFTGLFETRDAYLFGVPILCSAKASEIFQEAHKNKSQVQMQFFSDCRSQVEWICKTWNLYSYRLHNGGFYLYAPTENARMMVAQTFISEQCKKPFRIPAVYDFTLSPIRTIRMPFVGFLDPGMVVEWNSSSVIGMLVSFYYQPSKGKNLFSIISNDIDFSTVGDFNTMTINVIDAPYTENKKIPKAITNTVEKNYYRDVIIIPDDGMNSWKKVYNSVVTKIPVKMLPLWETTSTDENMQTTKDGRVSNYQFFKQMYDWNVSLFSLADGSSTGFSFDDSKKRIDSEADRLYAGTKPPMDPSTIVPHFPEITYCMETLADTSLKRIYMRLPIMPEGTVAENIDNDRVIVYRNGVWSLQLKTDMSDYKIGAF